MAVKVLIIDVAGDSPDALRSELQRCGFLVSVATDVDSALGVLCADRADVALIAGRLELAPDACGVLHALSSAPLLVIAGARDEARALALLRAGADRIIRWPCSRLELEARVRASLRERFTSQELGNSIRHAGNAAPEGGMRRTHGHSQSWLEDDHARPRGSVRKEHALAKGHR